MLCRASSCATQGAIVAEKVLEIDRIPRGAAKSTVMNALWERSPANARDVLEHCEPETSWAYTTVKTLLARLVDKGALAERKRANTSLYEPLVSRTEARLCAFAALRPQLLPSSSATKSSVAASTCATSTYSRAV